jgi:tRNA A37 threonylcarbamoyladenosine synthetase subunit TsaC/SUA5/YrdC
MSAASVDLDTLLHEADKAFEVIRAGGLALIPADIGYGFLGHSLASIEKMYALKDRRFDNPCITVGNLDGIASLALLPDRALLEWLAEISALTTLAVVVQVKRESPLVASLDPWVYEHSSNRGTMAIFLNPGPFVERMVMRAYEAGMILVGSSGNASGTGNNYRFHDVPQVIRDGVDYKFDAGPMRHENEDRMATTIVNLTNFTLRRLGVSHREIIESYERFARWRPDIPSTLTHMPKSVMPQSVPSR